jgi:NifU-like protein involved in Fe-S cluster formation
MKISDLEPGRRFRLPDTGKTGQVISTGDGGTRVKYDASARQVEFQAKSGDEVVADVAFEAPGRAVLISSGTVVEAL